jgi:hypothetical protein
MKIRLLRQWLQHRRNDVIEVRADTGRWLQRNKIGQTLEPEVAMSAPAEKAVRHRAKPRKVTTNG